jgi:hypothetical protein
VEEVATDQWLSNEVVDDILRKTFVDLKYKSKNDGNAENILLVPSTFWQAIGKVDISEDELKRFARYKFWKGKRPQDYSKVLLPFVDKGHWILAVLNFQKDQLEIYDSKFKGEKYYWSIRRAFTNFLKVANGPGGKVCDTFFLDKDVPTQSDGLNCGMYVIAFGRSIMKHTPFPETYNSALNSTKDVQRQLTIDRGHIVRKLLKYQGSKFPGHKYKNSKQHQADEAQKQIEEETRKKAEREAELAKIRIAGKALLSKRMNEPWQTEAKVKTEPEYKSIVWGNNPPKPRTRRK